MKIETTSFFNKNALLVLLIFIISVIPSSNGTDESIFIVINSIASMTICFFFLCAYGTTYTKIITLIFIVWLYFLSTIMSGFSDYTYGQILSFFPVLFVFSLNLRSINFKFDYLYVIMFFLFVSVLGWLSIFGGPLSDFLVHYYSSGYEGMVLRMLSGDKAVSIFGTHSISAFYYNLFSIYCFYLVCNEPRFKFINIILVINFQLMNASLVSNTSISFSVLFAFSCLYIAFIKINKELFLTCILILLSIVAVIFFINSEKLLPLVLGSSGNGLSSRYLDGVLQNTIEYILSNPLIGIGLSHSDAFYYTDSSYVTMALKLGIIGSLVFHLFAFNSVSSFDSRELNFIFILFFILFSVAYPIFNYYRFIGVFLILLLGYKSFKRVIDE